MQRLLKKLSSRQLYWLNAIALVFVFTGIGILITIATFTIGLGVWGFLTWLM